MEFNLSVDSCFLEEELLNGIDLKNVAHLKKMARVLVEERAIIKRVSKGESGAEGENNYSVEINLQHINPMTSRTHTPVTAGPLTTNIHGAENE